MKNLIITSCAFFALLNSALADDKVKLRLIEDTRAQIEGIASIELGQDKSNPGSLTYIPSPSDRELCSSVGKLDGIAFSADQQLEQLRDLYNIDIDGEISNRISEVRSDLNRILDGFCVIGAYTIPDQRSVTNRIAAETILKNIPGKVAKILENFNP